MQYLYNYINYEFTYPIFLKLLYLTPIFWLVAILGIKRLPIWRLVLSALLRSIVFAVVVLVLAGMSRVEKSLKDLQIIYLVDVSSSIDNDGKEWIESYINEMDAQLSEEIKRELKIFALNSKMVQGSDTSPGKDFKFNIADYLQPEKHKEEQQGLHNAVLDLNSDRTNISSAIISALGHFDEGSAKRIVLITDGNENVGDAIEATLLAKNENVKIYTVNPPKSSVENKILLKKVLVPPEIPEGKTAEIKVVVENKSDSFVDGNLEIFLHKTDKKEPFRLFKKWNASFGPGVNVFKAKYVPGKKGFVRFETKLDVNDKVEIEKNSNVNPVVITGKPKVLYVNGRKGRDLFLPDTLEKRDLDVEVVSSDQIPETILDMLVYDSIIFSNVPKSVLKSEQMEIIEKYVRDFGGGFVMLGGEDSFIQGGYADTPIEKILPVKMEGGEHKRKQKKYRFSLMLVVDKSASMGGRKMTFAKKATVELVRQLQDNDKLGIVAFDNNPYMITDLRPVPAVKVDLVSKLSRLHAGGGTNIFPALKMAFLNIARSNSKKNHVILLSDGNSEYLYYNKEALLKAYKNVKISVSTIAIGKWFVNTNLLKEIAMRTGGSFYRIDDVSQLPKLIIKDVEDSISKTDIHEEFFFPIKVTDSQILKDISQKQLPPLKGYSITTSKAGSETPLITDVRGKVDPILANWRYGLGKTLVYTADAEARWSSNWIKWMKYNKFWSQSLRWAMKDIPESDYSLKVEMVNDKPFLFIESFYKDEQLSAGKENMKNNMTTEIKVLLYSAGVDSRSSKNNPQYEELLLRQIAPKKYISSLEKIKPGNYFTNVLIEKNGKILSNKAKGLIIPQFKISRPSDTGQLYNNIPILKRVAQITDGKYDPDVNDIIKNSEEVIKFESLAKFLIPIAFAAFLMDIALRVRLQKI